MAFTPDQKRALDILRSGKNLFLTGDGGTGKSYVINTFVEECEKKHKNVVVTAPTGVAALNIHGATLHRVFKLSPDPQIENPTSIPKDLEHLDVLIIDEISMCRLDIFEYITKILYALNNHNKKANKKDVQVVVVGDFFQLPPVITEKDREILLKKYPYIHSGFAFESGAWNYYNFATVQLKTIVRQSDPTFVKALNGARVGNMQVLGYFAKMSNKDEQKDAIMLCGLNKKVNDRNTFEYNKIKSKEEIFNAIEIGDLKPTDKRTESVLKLKEGARVMTLVNHPDGIYTNGSLGTISFIEDHRVWVKLDTDDEVEIEPYTWEINDYKDVDGKLEKITVASFTQLPLKLAYAITIHKSQGQTYDKVNLDPYCWDCGQLYVALSRVKSIKGLHFVDALKPNYLKVNNSVINFYMKL